MKANSKKRAQFVTRTGVIAATVGSAVGLGNIWRFPYEAGMHGGAAFLSIYVVCVLAVGIPVMLAEFVIGRSTHSNSLGAFRKLRASKLFTFVPVMGIVASVLILSFYSVVAGWIVEYLYESARNLFVVADTGSYSEHFSGFITDGWRPSFWTLLFLAINYFVLARGVEKGIEKISNILMPLLFVILVVMTVNSLTLEGAAQGLRFLFNPDFSQITPSVVIGAMGQAFFSLSLGLTCLLTYASYFSDSTPLIKSATITAVLDTLVALLAGMMIFPAIFTYGVEPQAGPTLIFETLPAIFSQMPGGMVWSLLLFILLFFASLTSTISMSEISISYFVEEHHLSRRNATMLNIGMAMVFGVLCALSFGPLSHFTIFGKTIFNLFDYVSSNLLLPIGGLLMSVFVGWVLNRQMVESQLTNGGTQPRPVVAAIMMCMRWVAPVIIMLIFIYGLI